ncbi:ABC-three component system protein [Marinomonas shanghaiensis]|uniref:ABC-three component system protein n=1 Tax=Marinomonas shanghaiensis TaxID=2202418 RepID=UPI000DBA11BF|nr:ABC-three component system protein [Marinomonas shanghaiensis]
MTIENEKTDAPVNKIVRVERNAGNIIVGDSPEYEISSAINELLKSLANKPFSFQKKRRRPSSETVVKIEHNNLKSKSHIIKQYLDHSSKVEEAYSEIDSLIAFGKDTILQNLNDLYYLALDTVDIDYLTCDVDIENVRENSEFILDFIIQKLKNSVFESKNTPDYKEHIELGVNVVVAHAFIECIIMENPTYDS